MDAPGSPRLRRAALLGLLVLGIAAAPVVAADIPSGPLVGVQPFPGATVQTVCTPPDGSVTVRGKSFALPHASFCYSLEITTGTRSSLPSTHGGQLPGSGPLFEVPRGATVRFHFTSPPSGAVRLEVRRGPHLRSHATYRLSPYTTVWRARGTGGVLTLSVPFAPATAPWGEAVPNDGVYQARFVVR